MDTQNEVQGPSADPQSAGSKGTRPVSRRDFLKLAAVAGGAVGFSGGVSAILAACGGGTSQSTTTSASALETTTTAPASTTTAAPGSTTTASAAAQAGRPVKLGMVVPVTGPLAPFSAAAKWAKKHFEDHVGDGIVLGDKQKHPLQVLMVDTQSDSNRAAQVTGDLVQNSKADLLLAAVTPDTVNPAADVAESFGAPLISNWTEGHAFTLGRKAPAEGFKWTYTFAFDDVLTTVNYAGLLPQLPSNKIVGLVLANDVDGNNWAQWGPPILQQAGFKVVQTDLYTPGAEDYTAQITKIKNAGCELLLSVMLTPDFMNFWTQAHQQSFKPKIAIGHKGLIFPEGVAAMGPLGYNLCSAGTWTPRSTFKDSLTGMDCKQLAAEYEAFSGSEWSEAVIILALFEWAVDVFKRVATVDDKGAVAAAIKTTKLDTCIGLLDFTAPVKDQTHHPFVNACSPPQACGQWVKATSGKWPLDKNLVFTTDPGVIALDGKVQPIQYS
jgi:branched-chain amino acid transport system substrate-binding protein